MATISKKDRIFIIGSGIALMLGGAAVLVALSAAEVSKHDFGVIAARARFDDPHPGAAAQTRQQDR